MVKTSLSVVIFLNIILLRFISHLCLKVHPSSTITANGKTGAIYPKVSHYRTHYSPMSQFAVSFVSLLRKLFYFKAHCGKLIRKINNENQPKLIALCSSDIIHFANEILFMKCVQNKQENNGVTLVSTEHWL